MRQLAARFAAQDEAQTRDLFVDLLLGQAGWPLADDRDREFPVTGVPTVWNGGSAAAR